VVKIRNLGGQLGFEKIIIKNGMMIMFFISNPMSNYYKTRIFSDILSMIDKNSGLFSLKQTEGKLKIVTRGVDSLSIALSRLQKLQ
jgi:transcription-repair coupling factor (superfamily II helicase)